MYYAHLNKDNVCIAITESRDRLTDPRVVEIPSFDVSLLDKKRVAKTWEAVVRDPAPKVETQLDRIEKEILAIKAKVGVT